MYANSELRKLLVSLDIGQKVALAIFAVKRNVSEICKKLLNGIFAEFDGISPIKNIADRLDLGELQVDDISVQFTAKSLVIRKSSFK